MSVFTLSKRAGLSVACAVLFSLPGQLKAQSLQDLFNGGSVTVGDVQFHDWQFVSQDATAAILPNYSQIMVTPLNDDPINPGLKFTANGQLATAGTNLLSVEFGYSVSVTGGGPSLNGNSLTLSEYTFGGNGGNILISEDVSDTAGGDVGIKIVEADQGTGLFSLSDSITFPSQTVVRIDNLVALGGDEPADAVNLAAFSQRFSQVPEPSGLVLAILGAIAVVAIRKSRKLR